MNSSEKNDLFASVVKRAKSNELSDGEVADIATTLAKSGEILPSWKAPAADVASTGGPSSLSTLLCPLFLRSMGYVVPKLGVPGRPAGGVDVLAQIPGYKTTLSGKEVAAIVEKCGYAHFEGESVAPLDRELFDFRQTNGAQAVPTLVIASLLAKKLSASLDKVGLDVRVSNFGNFGQNFKEASENAKRFIRVAKLLKISATCTLTDGTYAYQPYLGRKESLLAMSEVMDGTACSWLERHVNQCKRIAHHTTNAGETTLEELSRVYEKNILAQGGRLAALRQLLQKTRLGHRLVLCARRDGFVSYDLSKIRTVIVREQFRLKDCMKYPDPVGIIIQSKDGGSVEKGRPLLSIRNDFGDTEILPKIEACISFSDMPAHARREDLYV